MNTRKFLNILLTSILSASMLMGACGKTETAAPTEDTLPSLTEASAEGEAEILNNMPDVIIDGNQFTVNGKPLWINGVNTPWDKWNDFGGAFNEEFWDQHFSDLHDIGINASRVWINCSGTTSIKVDDNGMVTKVTSKHWEHLDKLFNIADKYGIYLMPTLLSFDHFKDANAGYKGWRAMVSSEEGTQSFIDSYVIPFVERYGDRNCLLGIDLMNEPDWVKENQECGKLGWDILAPFFARCAAAIHENSSAYVTVGAAMIKYNSDKYDGNYFSDEFFSSLAGDNAYLDFWSTHYYYWQNSYMGFPFETTPEDFGLTSDKPSVIGETAAVDESGRDLANRYENAYNNGWNGVMAWTSNGVDGCGGFDDVKPAAEKIMEIAKDKVFPAE
ncbi:MAG: cellulase (glycosyl hydrolase family 5) [Huintestinicola sp.]